MDSKMDSKKDGDGSNILSFPDASSAISAVVHVREGELTAEGLLLMRAFFRIASSEDRRQIIALAQRLAEPDETAAQ
jgi:hypothetical protein